MYHKVILVGNLGKDPEMRYTPSGTPVTNFNVATSEKWTGQDGQPQERTIWWRVSAFGKQAETCNQYLKKGSKVLVEGSIRPDPKSGGPKIYQKQDGTAGSSYDITAQTIKFLTPKSEGQGGGQPGGDYAPEPITEEEGIPF